MKFWVYFEWIEKHVISCWIVNLPKTTKNGRDKCHKLVHNLLLGHMWNMFGPSSTNIQYNDVKVDFMQTNNNSLKVAAISGESFMPYNGLREVVWIAKGSMPNCASSFACVKDMISFLISLKTNNRRSCVCHGGHLCHLSWVKGTGLAVWRWLPSQLKATCLIMVCERLREQQVNAKLCISICLCEKIWFLLNHS